LTDQADLRAGQEEYGDCFEIAMMGLTGLMNETEGINTLSGHFVLFK